MYGSTSAVRRPDALRPAARGPRLKARRSKRCLQLRMCVCLQAGGSQGEAGVIWSSGHLVISSGHLAIWSSGSPPSRIQQYPPIPTQPSSPHRCKWPLRPLEFRGRGPRASGAGQRPECGERATHARFRVEAASGADRLAQPQPLQQPSPKRTSRRIIHASECVDGAVSERSLPCGSGRGQGPTATWPLPVRLMHDA